MERAYKIGTVETFTVRRSGRRFYVNLDADTVGAFGIQIGDRLIMKIIEGQHPHESELNRPALANVIPSVKSDIRPKPGGGKP